MALPSLTSPWSFRSLAAKPKADREMAAIGDDPSAGSIRVRTNYHERTSLCRRLAGISPRGPRLSTLTEASYTKELTFPELGTLASKPGRYIEARKCWRCEGSA